MFSERLERLIEAALQDGQLTEQEKAAIIKRAEAEGEDINEVDIYIQSLQQKRQQELNQQAQQAATEEMVAQKKAREAKNAAIAEEEKERAKLLRKCPACGTPIPAATNVCPNCGHIVESSDITNEISNMIRLIKKCAPSSVYSNGVLDDDTYRGKDICENDPDFHKLYNIIGERDDEYHIESKYSELIEDLELKFGANPTVQSFLLKEKKRIFGLLKTQLDNDIDWEWRSNSQQCFEVIKAQYAELIDESFINTYNRKIEEVRKKEEAKEAERAIRAAKEKTFFGRTKSFFESLFDSTKSFFESITEFVKKHPTGMSVLAINVVLWSISGYFVIKERDYNDEFLPQYKETIDAQYDSLMNILVGLPVVTESNYKEVESQLLKIVWSPISDRELYYERDKKEAYLKAKKGIAETILIFYDEEEAAPEQIRNANKYMKN